MAEQNLKNHARILPIFHYGVFLPLLAYWIWAIYRLVQSFGADSFFAALLATVLIIGFFSLRAQILTVQDRIIRLEMQLRLQRLLTPDLADRAAGLAVKQLVALRFASDAEVPELVGEILGGRVTTPKDIKARVVQWNADHLRA